MGELPPTRYRQVRKTAFIVVASSWSSLSIVQGHMKPGDLCRTAIAVQMDW